MRVLNYYVENKIMINNVNVTPFGIDSLTIR